MISHKFNRLLTPWGKGFLTSILGTTISILLTFGTSALVDNKMKADAQRQTAMMVIHDIDVCVEKLEEIADDEEKKNLAVQYILAHIDRIGSLPGDTLQMAMDMLTDYSVGHSIFDDSKENVFKSSQDVWSNLDNMTFVDNMEKFYHERRDLENQIADNPIIKAPITHDEYWQMVQNSRRSDHSLDLAAILKAKLREPRIMFYIDYSAKRVRVYRSYAQRWRDISDRNKFIMNIDDEELAEYIRDSQRSGNPVGRRDLAGRWEHKGGSGMTRNCFEFLANDSFRIKSVDRYPNVFYSGDILWTTQYRGTWRISGDTLLMVYDAQAVEVHMDRSGVTYRHEMRDSVENFIRRYFDDKEATARLRKRLDDHPKRDTFFVTTNKAHDKLEVVVDDSKDEKSTRYFTRIKDSR